jgi:hypothetical protein
MDPSTARFIQYCTAFILVSGTVMTGIRLWFKYRHLPPGSDPEILALRDEQARLEADLGSRIMELEQRLDFVERRLVQEQRPARLPEPPKAKTPA